MLRQSLFLFLLFLWCGRPARPDELQKSLQNPRLQISALQLARQALSHFLETGKAPQAPHDLPEALQQRAGVIVTIEKNGRIAPRGCRGTLQPSRQNLAHEIIANTVAAATRDAREKPLQKAELTHCKISLTIILSIKPIQNLDQHDARRCGLIAQRGNQIGLVLPYEGKDAQTQWKWARAKAGLKAGDQAQMLEVEAVRFREP